MLSHGVYVMCFAETEIYAELV